MGEILPQETPIRMSTYRSSDAYDPARKNLRFTGYQTLLTIALLFISLTGWGQSYWVGPAGGDWNTAAYWVPIGAPTANTNVIIPSGFTPNITGTASVCRNISLSGILNIDAGATLTVNGDWEVDQSVGGNVTGTGTVIFANNSDVADAIINSTTSTQANFYNIEVNRPGGSLSTTAFWLNVTNNLMLTNGTVNANFSRIDVGRAFTDGPLAIFNSNTSTIRFVGSSLAAPVSADQPLNNVEVRKTNGSIAITSNLTVNNLEIQSTLPAVVAPAVAASVVFSTPGVTMNVQGTLRVVTGTIDLSASDDTYLNVNGATTVSGGRIYIYRLATTSALTLNGGLNMTAGSLEVAPVSGPPALSKLTVNGLTRISGTGRLVINTTSTTNFNGNVELIATSRFDAYNSKIEVTGNWISTLSTFFVAGTSTVKLIGNTNTTIQGQCRFANLAVEKSGGALVTNVSSLTIDQNLLIQSGTLILTDVPLPVDMALKGDLTIIKDASVDIAIPSLVIEIGGNLEDQNIAEPTNLTPRRGLFIGMDPANPMGVRSCTPGVYSIEPEQDLPTIRFNGSTEQRITGYVPLRTYCGGFYPKNGIALPNIEIYKTDTVRLNSDVNVRIHGNLNIIEGGFNLSSQILYFGDNENDEINIQTLGTFTAPEGSQIFMNTGTTANGTFLKVNGGALKLLGKASNPVVITREGTVNQYFRMAAFSGTVEAIYTTISYQGSSNAGFYPDGGYGLAPDAITYQSAGGFKIYSSAVIDPNNLGYNFSYCVLGANAASGTTSLTINTGQDLNIMGTIFNTSGTGGINVVKNNADGIITFVRSSGELGGVNGEFYDGGYYADPVVGYEEGVVWETFTRMYWIGNTYDGRPNTDATTTKWSDPRNWSLSPNVFDNPNNIYPGQYPAPSPLGGKAVAPDYLQQFEVFISASARTSPIVDGNYVIQGTVINNAVGRYDSFDLNPVLIRSGKTLDLNGHTLTVWGDFVNNNRDANGNNLAGSNAIIKANPGGTVRFRANLASFHGNATIDAGSGFVVEAFDNNPLQEIKIAANDLQEFTINKPEGRVVVQGFGSDRLDVRRNLTILSGGMEMLTNTPLLVDGNFNISGGFFTFNSSIAIVRGNWNNTGGTINTGGGIVYFYPSDNITKIVRSNGQSFNQVNFGMINNTTGALSTPLAPASPGLTTYRIVDHFTATNLVTIAARGQISGTTYNDAPAVNTTTNPAQPRIVVVEANVTVRVNGMRVRENGELILKEGATLLISNNTKDFTVDNYNPFPAALNPLGLRIEGAALSFPNGKLTAIGTAENYVKISRNGIAGVYNFKVNGTLSNRYYLFEFMDTNGVDLTAATSTTISPGTAIIPANGVPGTQTVNVASFSDGILTNGTIGGVYIKYTDNASIFGAAPDTIYNVNFPVPLLDGLGSGANIRRTSLVCAAMATGVVWFRNATGSFAGEAFDDDGSACGLDQIQWRQPQIRKWDGGAGNSFWHAANNWIPDGVPLPDEDVVLDHTYVPGVYTVNITNSTGDVVANNLSIINNTNSNQITLQLSDAKNLKINKGFTIDVPIGTAFGKLVLDNGTSMEVGENWSNKGSFVVNTAPVAFGAGYKGSRVIFNAKPTSPAAYNATANLEPSKYTDNVFHKIIMKSGRTELNSDLMVKDSLIVNTGARLDNSSSSDPQSILKGPNGIHPNTILIEGNWVNNGRFYPTDGTVNFVGLNEQILVQQDTVTENFYTLKIEKLFNASNLSDHRNVTLWSKATVSNELNLQRGRFITRQGRELILLTDNIIRNSAAANTTAYVKGPLGQLYKGIGEIKHKFAVGDQLWPGDFAYLTVKLTSTSTDKGTVFIMEQKDSDPDPSFNPLYPNDPAPYGEDRVLPRPLNFLSRSRYWNVKNIMFPITKPTAGLNAELQRGKIELPLAVQDEDATVTTSNGWVTTPDQTLADVLSELQELSIVQDSLNMDSNPDYAPASLTTQVNRGWAEQGEKWGDLGGELNVKESGGAIKATYTSNPFYKLGNGDFAFAWNYIPLPVEFLSLEASKKEGIVPVKWIIASERNIIQYVVERSSNGKDFVKIGDVYAKGSESLATTYTLTDASPLSGTAYYRVYSVDMLGVAQYSKTVVVNASYESAVSTNNALLVYPNPFNGRNINLSLDNNEGNIHVAIYDMMGKQVYTTAIQHYTKSPISINMDSPLTQGMYVMQIITEKGVYKQKILVK
jgi:hypothetical protein